MTLTVLEDNVPLAACSLDEFLAANELDPAEIEAIARLGVGESYQGGGGAAPVWSVRRDA